MTFSKAVSWREIKAGMLRFTVFIQNSLIFLLLSVHLAAVIKIPLEGYLSIINIFPYIFGDKETYIFKLNEWKS